MTVYNKFMKADLHILCHFYCPASPDFIIMLLRYKICSLWCKNYTHLRDLWDYRIAICLVKHVLRVDYSDVHFRFHEPCNYSVPFHKIWYIQDYVFSGFQVIT